MTIDDLRRKAANWPSPHVRRITPIIDLVHDGLKKLGINPTPRGARQVAFEYNGKRYRAGYDHPVNTPRQRGAITIWRMNGVHKIVVRRFETLEQGSRFLLHPTLE